MKFIRETTTEHRLQIIPVATIHEYFKYLGVKDNKITELSCVDIYDDVVTEDKSFVGVSIMLEDSLGNIYPIEYFDSLYLIDLL